MKYFYSLTSASSLINKFITNTQLTEYANTKKSYPTRVASIVVFFTVQQQIDANKPIYLGTYGIGNYKGFRNALVLRGYNIDSGLYSVWNPWNKSYTVMPMSNKSISGSGYTLVWDTTIYN